MPALDEMLADLAAHPPSDPPPVGTIQGRARRRVRRRRALAGTAAAVVLLAVGVGVAALVTDDPDDEVVADGGTTIDTSAPTTGTTTAPSTPTTSIPVATDEPTMTLDPASGYVDGTVVEMALDEPATGPALVAQCAAEAEARGAGPDVQPWCTSAVEMQAEALQPFSLRRTIETPDGVVDCAEAVGRCTLGVRIGGAGSSDDRFAPLAFRPDLPAPVEPAVLVDGDEGTVGDGDTRLITLPGVETGDVVRVMQCRPASDPEQGDEDGLDCSSARGREITVQDGPETQLEFTAFREVLVNTATAGQWAPGWVTCAPCRLAVRIDGRQRAVAVLPLVMEPTDAPIRPTIELEPAGPHAPGATVDVRVAGLQPSTTADISWCLVLPPQGGGDSPCNYPGDGGAAQVAVGEDGTAELAGFTLPPDGAVQGVDCRSAPETCGIGIHDPGWFTYLAIAPLDLSG
ncbi:MAG TPA: hypothetical protein VF228_01555 [Iamia sp.]